MTTESINFLLTEYGLRIHFTLAIFCILINIPHLFILTRPNMRTSSTNSILIGIPVFDSIFFTLIINERIHQYWIYPLDNLCVNPNTYIYEMIRWIKDFLNDTCERSSFWLGVFLALVRLLIMKTELGFLVKPILGYLIVLIVFLVSAMFSAYNFSKYTVVRAGVWEPDEDCHGFPGNYSEPMYYQVIRKGYQFSDFFNTYNLIDGMSRILIAVIYPLLALTLFFEIWKNAKYASKALNKKECVERFRTARMILVMTLFYVISSVPVAICDFLQLFMDIEEGSAIEMIVGFGYVINNILYCLNSMSHSVINFVMSTQYQKTVRMVIHGK
ncbi:hypothetical protein CAEBREN_20515 [Caenorhabditis brenneri]|uniref:G-protein coupled receptors family 1 profile domain-containing protein n=1 Tax=Caenorhabditis brenneri TaxID=135651 RepID=G0M9R8_CAEBE|nr:hypothetical protein CAEBREN_20515 [Caenorhabditis brenneri]